MRVYEITRWDPELHKVDGSYLLATHDAYYWVAGAEGRNLRSENLPMATLARVGADLLNVSTADFAFWAPIFLAVLTAIPIALWAFLLDARFAALFAAVLGSLAPTFYTRTRLGFFDTDWATMFFPILISLLLAAWLIPRIHLKNSIRTKELLNRLDPVLPIILILVLAVGVPWHNFIPLYALSILFIALFLIVIFGVEGTRSSSLLLLLLLGITLWLGWVGAVLGLILWFMLIRSKMVFTKSWHRNLLLILLIALLGSLSWSYFEGYIVSTLSTYAREVVSTTSLSFVEKKLDYPLLVSSLRETQTMSLKITLQGMAFLWWIGVLGVLGFLFLLYKRPITILLLPLLLLGFLSIRLGARFTMFASPVIFLGLFVPLDWGMGVIIQKSEWGWKRQSLIGFAGLLAIFIMVFRTYMRLPIETAIGKGHAEVLTKLREEVQPDETIWTWWDFGYATQYFTGLHTFSDGGRNSGEFLVTLGNIFGTSDPNHSAGMIQFATSTDFKPWVEWETWEEDQLEGWFASLGDTYAGNIPDPAHYIIIPWDAITFLPWIQYYGSWDFLKGEGELSRVEQVKRPRQLDLETGEFFLGEDDSGYVLTVDLIGKTGLQHFVYSENIGGPHLLLDTTSSKVFLLDEVAYQSVLVQLLLLPPDATDLELPYELLIDGFPDARVFVLE